MNPIITGDKEYFKGIGQIKFEGQESDNPFAFRWYDENKIIAGKSMKEHLRFACAYWHSFCGNGGDPFGEPTHLFEWNEHNDPITRAKAKMDAAFEFFTKMNIPFYCFHDIDLVEYTNNVCENEKRLQTLAEYALQKQKESNVKLLWATANLTSNRRYMNGASTNPDFHVLAHAGAQVKATLDATILLNGENYVFWGGREGYMTLINTNMKRELEHLAKFFHLARDYGRKNGFKGNFFIEPKPCEPSKHQYDYDAATVIGFLREFDLMDDYKLNIEINHATLAGHTFQHELQVAANAGMLGSIDANKGDYQNGWDTDQFANNIYELVEAMLVIIEAEGFKGGGINFDAKRRRNSTDKEDIFYGHIGSMDAFARALIITDNILNNSDYRKIRSERYASFDTGNGKDFEKGKLTLTDLRNFAEAAGEPPLISGKQEYLENIINRFL